MASRNWYLVKALGLRLLVGCALASWVVVVALALKSEVTPTNECVADNQLYEVILSGN